MPIAALKRFLDEHRVKYVTIQHSRAYTASEIAYKSHMPHQELAKTVVVKVGSHLAMAVVPASRFVDFARLSAALGNAKVELADESDFQDKFPGCEIGAMPPFGNLFDMPVFVSEKLASNPEIAFNAGTHAELIRLSFADFASLAKPRILDF
jgi:Ala-tRNA(Pro) deacylase